MDGIFRKHKRTYRKWFCCQQFISLYVRYTAYKARRMAPCQRLSSCLRLVRTASQTSSAPRVPMTQSTMTPSYAGRGF
ncbi:MAG: hypothetical protein K6A36_07530 [Paludibacteraceae bacterium]|nr:hypothetical protein [Paludibacteraceae bacterium]